MGIPHTKRVWLYGPPRSSDRLVLLAIADRANHANECWPGTNDIATRTAMTDRGVRNILDRLEAEGFLEIDRRSGPGKTHKYRIPEWLMALDEDGEGSLDGDQKTPRNGGSNRNGVPWESRDGTGTGFRGDRNGVQGEPERGSAHTGTGFRQTLKNPNEPSLNPHTPPTPRRAGGAGVPDRKEGFAEEGERVGEVVAFPSRQRPVANPDAGHELPKRPDRKSRRTLAGPLCPGCNTLDDEAEIFWQEYPIRENWGTVRRKWKAARREATFEEIMAGLEAYKTRTDNPRDRGFRVTPDKWLDAQKWADERRESARGVETTTDRLRRLGATGTDGHDAIDGPRKAPAISFEDLGGRDR